MNQPTMVEIYTDHYDSLKEEQSRVMFLLKLKMMGSVDSLDAFRILARRWIVEPVAE
jgi:hypothetical protein